MKTMNGLEKRAAKMVADLTPAQRKANISAAREALTKPGSINLQATRRAYWEALVAAVAGDHGLAVVK